MALKKNDIVLYRPIADRPEGSAYLVSTDSFVRNGNELVFLSGKSGYVLASHCTLINADAVLKLDEERARCM